MGPHWFCCVNQVFLKLNSMPFKWENQRGLYQSRVTSSLACIYGQVNKHTTANWPIGQTKDKKQANGALQTTGELLRCLPNKIRFVFRSKTFPTDDSLMQKRSNVQGNNDVTKQGFSPIRNIKQRGHFGNVFLKPSAVFCLLSFNFFTLFLGSEKNCASVSF